MLSKTHFLYLVVVFQTATSVCHFVIGISSFFFFAIVCFIISCQKTIQLVCSQMDFFFSRIQLLIPQAEHFLYLATWIWNSGFSLLSYFVIGISSLYFLPYLFQWLEVCFVFVCFLKRRHKCHMSVLLIVVKILLVIWPQKLLRRLNSLIVERVEICT